MPERDLLCGISAEHTLKYVNEVPLTFAMDFKM